MGIFLWKLLNLMLVALSQGEGMLNIDKIMFYIMYFHKSSNLLSALYREVHSLFMYCY